MAQLKTPDGFKPKVYIKPTQKVSNTYYDPITNEEKPYELQEDDTSKFDVINVSNMKKAQLIAYINHHGGIPHSELLSLNLK